MQYVGFHIRSRHSGVGRYFVILTLRGIDDSVPDKSDMQLRRAYCMHAALPP